MKASVLINTPTVRHHPVIVITKSQKPKAKKKKVEGNTLNGKLFHPPRPTRLHGTSGHAFVLLVLKCFTPSMDLPQSVTSMKKLMPSCHFYMIQCNRGKCWNLTGDAQRADLSSIRHTFRTLTLSIPCTSKCR